MSVGRWVGGQSGRRKCTGKCRRMSKGYGRSPEAITAPLRWRVEVGFVSLGTQAVAGLHL